MLIVTNRNLEPSGRPEELFGPGFNEGGPDELRLASATKTRGKWKVDIHDDTVEHEGTRMHASEQQFLLMQERMRKKSRNCLFFVHGFNNDLLDVLERGRLFERNYRVEVVAFTWPANGRGSLLGRIGGTASYKSDKRDAVRSAIALDRALEKLAAYLDKHMEDTRRCNMRVSLLMHSMGNYLFKNLMRSSVYQGETGLFDNVILAAADVNNAAHEEWVDRIQCRRRIYITINEDDEALALSRAKFGEKQRARLGHFAHNLNSRQAVYLDFTGSPHVEDSHAYFEGEPIRYNPLVRHVFNEIVNGRAAERRLVYDIHSRTYRLAESASSLSRQRSRTST